MRQVLVDVTDGLKALRAPDIGRPLAAVWLHRLLLGAGFVLLVLIADSEFDLGISGYALALAVTGAAAFVGSVAAPVLARRWSPLALLPVAFLPPAAAVYVGGLAPNLVVLVVGAKGGYVGRDGLVIGIDRFGESAPEKDLRDLFGFTPAKVAERIQGWLRART